MAPRYLLAGETALVVEFGETADRAFHDQVLVLDAALSASPIEGVRETVPTYRSLMIHFDPRALTTEALIERLGAIELADAPRRETKRWRIPACWEAPHAEDLDDVAQTLDMTPDKVVDLHAGATYRVVMYGFAPGFVFLDGLPAELKIPRRKTPRPPAQPGALTIAAGQALIASIAMPTGWYVLGRTPARTFRPDADPAFPLGIGDEVAFERVDVEEFEALEAKAAAGETVLGEALRMRGSVAGSQTRL